MADAKMALRNQKVLYFLRGMVPTQDDLEIADKIPGRVMFRNASLIEADEHMEPCDAVGGHVPVAYSTKKFVGDKPNPVSAKPTKKAASKSEPPKPADWKPNGSE